MQSNLGNLYVIAAPSGTGKTTLVKAVTHSLSGIIVSISHTTRPKRPAEINGVNYYFIDPSEFQTMIAHHDFLEHAKVFNHFYGTSRPWIESQMIAGSDVMLEIDWQGAQQIRKMIPSVQWIFIFPPSIEALEERLRKRGQDDEATIERRLAAAHIELGHAHEADFIVVNDSFEQALADLKHILAASRLQSGPSMARNPALLKRLGV